MNYRSVLRNIVLVAFGFYSKNVLEYYITKFILFNPNTTKIRKDNERRSSHLY